MPGLASVGARPDHDFHVLVERGQDSRCQSRKTKPEIRRKPAPVLAFWPACSHVDDPAGCMKALAGKYGSVLR